MIGLAGVLLAAGPLVALAASVERGPGAQDGLVAAMRVVCGGAR